MNAKEILNLLASMEKGIQNTDSIVGDSEEENKKIDSEDLLKKTRVAKQNFFKKKFANNPDNDIEDMTPQSDTNRQYYWDSGMFQRGLE